MKCPQCVKENRKSTVTEGVRSSTCLYCPPFYDEDGNRHTHDSNIYTIQYTCSNGHSWAEAIKHSCWCGWPDVEKKKPVTGDADFTIPQGALTDKITDRVEI